MSRVMSKCIFVINEKYFLYYFMSFYDKEKLKET